MKRLFGTDGIRGIVNKTLTGDLAYKVGLATAKLLTTNRFRDVRKSPFALHGFYEPVTEPFFRRVPADIAAATSEGVDKLSRESAGGRVRFSTDSPYIAIRAKYLVVGRSPHLTLISSSGFDLYTEGEFGSRFVKEFRMPYDMGDSYEQILFVGEGGMRSYTVNFPVHAVVESLEIGLKPDASVGMAKPYRNIKPVIFYGSSIVHGTAATRPGYTYSAIISRELNLDFRNIGFSGQAKGERVLAQWLATLPMSVFVYDYDHNAPSVEHLKDTHYPLYTQGMCYPALNTTHECPSWIYHFFQSTTLDCLTQPLCKMPRSMCRYLPNSHSLA